MPGAVFVAPSVLPADRAAIAVVRGGVGSEATGR